MLNGKRILAIIPARGGSKGIPNKNIRLINGKPLIFYTINEAKKSKIIDNIIVSTDSKKIANISIKYGANVPFLRPSKLAKDTSKTIECVIYSIKKLKEMGETFDILVLLQPTSPLRTYKDILNAVKLHIKTKNSVVSLNKIDINPLLIRTVGKQNKLSNLLNLSSTLRRQDLPKYFKVNGAIYVNSIKSLNENTSFNDNEYGYVMNLDNSIDIDIKRDLIEAKKLINKKYKNL